MICRMFIWYSLKCSWQQQSQHLPCICFWVLLWFPTHQFHATFTVQLCCQYQFPIACRASQCCQPSSTLSKTYIEKVCWWEVYIVFFTFPPLIRTNATYNGPAMMLLLLYVTLPLTLAFWVSSCAQPPSQLNVVPSDPPNWLFEPKTHCTHLSTRIRYDISMWERERERESSHWDKFASSPLYKNVPWARSFSSNLQNPKIVIYSTSMVINILRVCATLQLPHSSNHWYCSTTFIHQSTSMKVMDKITFPLPILLSKLNTKTNTCSCNNPRIYDIKIFIIPNIPNSFMKFVVDVDHALELEEKHAYMGCPTWKHAPN